MRLSSWQRLRRRADPAALGREHEKSVMVLVVCRLVNGLVAKMLQSVADGGEKVAYGGLRDAWGL